MLCTKHRLGAQAACPPAAAGLCLRQAGTRRVVSGTSTSDYKGKDAAARRCVVARTAPSPTPVTPADEEAVHMKKKILGLKMKILAAVASLDRGLAANGREAREVDELVHKLESLCQPVVLTWTTGTTTGPSTLGMLQGTWRLIYTSGFNTGSLGGRRPGPPAALVPSILGQVYQRIDPGTGRLDNIVEFLFASGLPSLPDIMTAFQSNSSSSSSRSYPESPALRLTLKHDYQLKGTNGVEIVYEDTSAELVGSTMFANLPKFDLPNLPEFIRPPKGLRSATFDVVFLDDNMRVTRGDRNELRIYLKDDAAAASLGGVPVEWNDTDVGSE